MILFVEAILFYLNSQGKVPFYIENWFLMAFKSIIMNFFDYTKNIEIKRSRCFAGNKEI